MGCSRQHWVVFCIFLCSLALPIRCQNANTDNWQATERLLTAVRNGDVPAAIAALRAGANANADGTPETYNLPPLHLACALASPAHLHIVRLLLRTGANVNAESTGRFLVPLYYAAGVGGAHPRKRDPVTADGILKHDGTQDPQSLAQHDVTRAAIVRLLLRAGANVNAPADVRLLEAIASASMRTPLCFTVFLGLYPRVLSTLLHFGARPNDICGLETAQDGNFSALHILGISSYRPHVQPMWNSLLEFGANPTAVTLLDRHTPLHFSAIQADPVFVDDVLSFFGPDSTTLRNMLTLKDRLGRTVYDIAVLRPVYHGVKAVLERHAQRADIQVPQMRGVTSSALPDQPPPPSPDEQRAHSEYGGYQWTTADTEADTGECDLDVVHFSQMSLEKFERDYLRLRRPVVIVGNISQGWPAWHSWRKSELLRKHGKRVFMAGPIPYGDVFGRRYRKMSVAEFLKRKQSNISSLASAPQRGGDDEPWIMFEAEFDEKVPELIKDVPHPPLFADRRFQFSTAGCQFSLGSFGAGAPFHHHSSAYNIVLYGRKRWFVSPPGLTARFLNLYREPSSVDETDYFSGLFNSGKSTLAWFHDDYKAHRARHHVITCTQYAGYMMYVPSMWAHSTLNLAETLAVAREFTMEAQEVGGMGAGSFARERLADFVGREREEDDGDDERESSDFTWQADD